MFLFILLTTGLVPWGLDAWAARRAVEAAESLARYHFVSVVAEAAAVVRRDREQLPIASWLAEPGVRAVAVADAAGIVQRHVARTPLPREWAWAALWSAPPQVSGVQTLSGPGALRCLGRDLGAARLGICYDLAATVASVRGDRGLGTIRLVNFCVALGVGGWLAARRRQLLRKDNSGVADTSHAHLAPTPNHFHWAVHAADIVPQGVLVFDVGLRVASLNAEARTWFAADAAPPLPQTHAVDVAAQLSWGDALLAALEHVVAPGPASVHVPRDARTGRALSVARLEGAGEVYGYWVMGIASA